MTNRSYPDFRVHRRATTPGFVLVSAITGSAHRFASILVRDKHGVMQMSRAMYDRAQREGLTFDTEERRKASGRACVGFNHKDVVEWAKDDDGIDPDDTSLVTIIDHAGNQCRGWLCEWCKEDEGAENAILHINGERSTDNPRHRGPSDFFVTGDRVRFRADFLRNTGQYVGPEAPTHVGPFARGEVVEHGAAQGLPEHVVVRFDDGWSQLIHAGNLEVSR